MAKHPSLTDRPGGQVDLSALSDEQFSAIRSRSWGKNRQDDQAILDAFGLSSQLAMFMVIMLEDERRQSSKQGD